MMKKQSDRQEKRITKSFKQIEKESRKSLASGAMWFDKSDVITSRFQIECKTKVKPSKQITVKKEWFDKINIEAFENNKIGLLAISFGDGEDYICMKKEDFIEMVGAE